MKRRKRNNWEIRNKERRKAIIWIEGVREGRIIEIKVRGKRGRERIIVNEGRKEWE